jgi:hypothetical protein
MDLVGLNSAEFYCLCFETKSIRVCNEHTTVTSQTVVANCRPIPRLQVESRRSKLRLLASFFVYKSRDHAYSDVAKQQLPKVQATDNALRIFMFSRFGAAR